MPLITWALYASWHPAGIGCMSIQLNNVNNQVASMPTNNVGTLPFANVRLQYLCQGALSPANILYGATRGAQGIYCLFTE